MGEIRVCPVDAEPVIWTFEYAGYEYVCVVCGWLGGAFGTPVGEATERRVARYAELRETYERGRAEREGREHVPVPQDREPPSCGGCGEKAAGWLDVEQPVIEDLDGAPLPPTCQKGGAVYEAIHAWMRSDPYDEIGQGIGSTELRNLLIALAPHLRAEDDVVDWQEICARAAAVARGAGAPDDGATLPEQIEWLAYQLHGPSLQPDGGSPLERALEAIRLTQEYAQLPAIEGWTWYDVYRSLRSDDAERLRQDWLRHDAARRAAREQGRLRGDRRRRWGFGRR